VPSGHRQIDHTADLALELWADSEEDLLVVAAQAVIEILAGEAPIADRAGRDIAIQSVDAADRLVQWVNEIIVAAIADGFLFRTAAIDLHGETGLTGRARGEPDGHGRIVAELKSATYHDLALETGPAGWRARVIIDV
jgi:SHS2 domain-containing protein